MATTEAGKPRWRRSTPPPGWVEGQPETRASGDLTALAAAVALSLLLRAPALGQDPWLDEIWSLQMASGLRHAGQIFTLAFDNNHILVTAVMWLLGDVDAFWLYRLPSLVAGVAAVVLAFAMCAGAQDRAAGSYAAWIIALSFPLIVFSVEARGYALAVAFAFATYRVFERSAPIPSWRRLVMLWLLPSLGLLAHLSFVFFYAAYGLWSALRCHRTLGPARALRVLWLLHCVPGAVLVLLHVSFVRDMKVAGGESWTYSDVLARATAMVFNAPNVTWVVAPLGLAVLLLPAWDAYAQWRAGRDSWPVPPAVVLVFPACIAGLMSVRYLSPRYFLLPLAFLLVSLARALAALAARGRLPRSVALAMLSLFALGGPWQWLPFVRDGRGHYAAAVAAMGAETEGPRVVVGSDHDVRNARVLQYHQRALPPGKRMVYVPRADRAELGPDWIVLHNLEREPPARRTLRLRSGDSYVLRGHYPHSGPAGVDWYLYRKHPGPEPRR